MPILGYTTTIDATKTANEMSMMLAKAGASAVATRYEAGQPVGISFQLGTQYGERTFTLPCNVDGVQRVLKKQLGSSRRSSAARESQERTQAERVAWRILKTWLAAQLAIIESEMVDLTQIMLPYMHTGGELTVWEQFQASEQLAITSGDRSAP